MEFRKAHGTGNDFVVLPDPEGALDLSDSLVRGLCDRRFGIGADGVLRVVRTAAAGERIPDADGCEFFMDYRNADGSLAEMCGNGARVFAQYLWQAGLAAPGLLRFGTRGGARTALACDDGQVTVDMGVAEVGDDDAVRVLAADRWWPARPVHVPNPHAVVFVEDLADAGPLREPPGIEPVQFFPDGTNVEFVVAAAPDAIAMRVHERGSGETMSCGTGACAAAVAHLARLGPPSVEPVDVQVDVPGGTLRATVRPDATVALTGPTVTVAEGRVDDGWLEAMS